MENAQDLHQPIASCASPRRVARSTSQLTALHLKVNSLLGVLPSCSPSLNNAQLFLFVCMGRKPDAVASNEHGR